MISDTGATLPIFVFDFRQGSRLSVWTLCTNKPHDRINNEWCWCMTKNTRGRIHSKNLSSASCWWVIVTHLDHTQTYHLVRPSICRHYNVCVYTYVYTFVYWKALAPDLLSSSRNISQTPCPEPCSTKKIFVEVKSQPVSCFPSASVSCWSLDPPKQSGVFWCSYRFEKM